VSDAASRWPIRWELLTTIGVVGAQLVGIAVWLGTEHASRIALEERVTRNEVTVSTRLDRIEADQRTALRELGNSMEKVGDKLEELRVLVAARFGK
jgi:hypothetical protein